MRSMRNAMTPENRHSASMQVIDNLQRLSVFNTARTIHTYVAWRDEVDNHALIAELLRQGRTVIVPKVDLAHQRLLHYRIDHFCELRPGAFGILEPHDSSHAVQSLTSDSFDLILVPGVAFDVRGNRLGYGGGYYDRFLQSLTTPTVALAFDRQLVPALPVQSHDRAVQYIVTESRIIHCRTAEDWDAQISQ